MSSLETVLSPFSLFRKEALMSFVTGNWIWPLSPFCGRCMWEDASARLAYSAPDPCLYRLTVSLIICSTSFV